MKGSLTVATLLGRVLLPARARAQGGSAADPEDVGPSSAALARGTATVNAVIAEGCCPGAVAPVARHLTGPAGEHRRGGAGTAFSVDPKEQMVARWMAQAQPGPRRGEGREQVRQLVPAAVAD